MSSPPKGPKPNLPTIEITPPSPTSSEKNAKAGPRDASAAAGSAQLPASSLPDQPTPPPSEQPAPTEDQAETTNKPERKRSSHTSIEKKSLDLESHFEQLKKEFEETTGRSWIPLKPVSNENDDWDWYNDDEEEEDEW
ncbi:hypothetical protein BCR34DRAFT_619138 [Clohesyomyces aquaticus]|uniref:Uncharacterized protein n=1 Tax=Clohesyomyces aquaticus TaxID=1231657 RepID=A0A1Y1YKA4_9PLEO|nr:hypothetical protein BCR34DRAFT_619138 [Clohesyomyces aquaticus]